jgi:hypothetical protein
MRIHRFALFIAILALSACAGPEVKTVSYTAPNTPGGRLCTGQCGEARDYCREDCNLDQRRCTTRVQGQALMDYEKYMSEQFLHADAIELRARDFERMTPCNDAFKSCSDTCDDHYQSCYTDCGGKVETSTSCAFFCF